MRLRWHDPPAIAEADAFDDALDLATVPPRDRTGSARQRLVLFLGRSEEPPRPGPGPKARGHDTGRPREAAAPRRSGSGGGREGASVAAAPQARPGAASSGGRATGRRVVHHLIAGAVAGATAKTVEAPLDRVKIIFQVSKQRFSFAAAAKQMGAIAKTEGLSGLWKGNGACVGASYDAPGAQLKQHVSAVLPLA